MAGDPNNPHWWMQPIDLEELKKLRDSVKQAHQSGLGFAGITLNRIEIALEELQERKEADGTTTKA